MKFKSLITTTLALGVLASTGANFNTNEASAAAKQIDKSSSSLHHGYSKIQIPYTITVNGTSQNILSSLTFNKNQQISYKDIENKVKSVLYFNRGISDIDLRLSKQAKYTVHFKNGTKRVVDLKAGIHTADLINTSDIKAISVNVDTKKQVKDKEAKANVQVPYTITVNGTSQNILSNLTFKKNQQISYKDLENNVKSVLKSNRGITDVDLRLSKQAKFTVNFKNGTKKVINLNSKISQLNLLFVKDIKKIDVDVKTGSKAKADSYVPYTIAVNGTSTPIASKLKLSNKQLIGYQDLNKKVKSVLKHDRGINDIELKFAKQAKYTVHFKNGKTQVVDLKSDIFTRNLFSVKDIKKIDIDVKQHTKSNKALNKVANIATKVKFPVTINGFSNVVSNEFAFLHPHKITTNDLNAKLRLALASDQGITKHDIGLSERTVYKVYFKDGSSKFVDLKAAKQDSKVFKATDIKKVDIEIKF
ncbi:TPA: MAP domain-containing protein [Staphylococcus aureus]|uniref:MAP domain-containing protein n=1 Tax=Staphylococcus aureus TaxID=1280 RepID=UPI0029B23C37|nr:MAP domain-containing protein [Staphylococcus aureus]HEI6600958.1 MAP domain-containing protein [Staphylococcus aureus]